MNTFKDVWEDFSQVYLWLNHSLTALGPGTTGTPHPRPPPPPCPHLPYPVSNVKDVGWVSAEGPHLPQL